MAITVQLSNYRYVDIVIAPLDDNECTIKINKETLAAVLNEEAIVVEQREFILFTKNNYTVYIRNDKDRDRYLHYAGVNIKELHYWIANSEALFEIDTVYVYVNSLKRILVVYLPYNAKVIRNDYV